MYCKSLIFVNRCFEKYVCMYYVNLQLFHWPSQLRRWDVMSLFYFWAASLRCQCFLHSGELKKKKENKYEKTMVLIMCTQPTKGHIWAVNVFGILEALNTVWPIRVAVKMERKPDAGGCHWWGPSKPTLTGNVFSWKILDKLWIPDVNAVEPRYLELAYFELPLISKWKSGPCFNMKLWQQVTK